MRPGCPVQKQTSGVEALRGRDMESEKRDVKRSLGALQLKSRLSHPKGRTEVWQDSYLATLPNRSSFWNFKSQFCGFTPATLCQEFLPWREIEVYPFLLRFQQQTKIQLQQGSHWEPTGVLDLQNVVEGFLVGT